MTDRTRCSRCVMDTTVPTIRFNEDGVCNYCRLHEDMDSMLPLDQAPARLEAFVQNVKRTGRKKRYDCIVGVSGGTDSTYALYQACQLGLRPLAVHYDNGWNSVIGVNNIKTACRRLGVDLFTVVADWEEFKDLQIAFLQASVPDLEMPTDCGIFGALYKTAISEGVRFIISGASFRTEGKIPLAWGYGDGRYIESIYRLFGAGKRLRDFPAPTLGRLMYYSFVRHIRVVRFLEMMDYSKPQAKKLLTQELDWVDYGGHHYESIYTRYYQSYLTRYKFYMDRRKVALSAAIREGAVSREQALELLAQEPYPMEKIAEDEEYILQKLQLAEEQLREYLNREPKTFLDYPTYYPMFRRLRQPLRLAYRLKLSPTRFFEDFTLNDSERLKAMQPRQCGLARDRL